MKNFLLLAVLSFALISAPSVPDYSIYAIRYADSPQDRLSDLMVGGPADERLARVIPGHDALQFQKYRTHGRVADLKLAKSPEL